MNNSSVQSIISIQISASVTAPIIAALDIYGFMNRHMFARLFPKATQSEMNSAYFTGTAWLLAERYTGLAKVIYISLFFAIITPASLFVASGACILLFFIDKYLLLRRWAKAPMMDASLADRVSNKYTCDHVKYVFQSFVYSFAK